MVVDSRLSKYIKKGIKPGLERIARSLSVFMDIENPPFKIIHIAGTNGKGTTANLLSSYLSDVGVNTALFTSPHIQKVNERIKVHGIDISDDDFLRAIDFVELNCFAEELTYFEILNVVAMFYFYKQNVEYVVLETGLGGRLDSTNVTSKLISIVTHVDYDHVNILGSDILSIFKQKYAITVKSEHALVAPQKYCEINEFLDEGNSSDIPFLSVEINSKSNAFQYNYSIFFSVITFLSKNYGIRYDASLLDDYKNREVSGRITISKKSDFTIIKDVAHNLNGIENLVDFVGKKFPDMKFNVYFSVLEDKNYSEMVNELSKVAKIIYFYAVDSKETQRNSVSFADLMNHNNKNIIKKVSSLEEIDICDNTIFCGSFYLISQIVHYL